MKRLLLALVLILLIGGCNKIDNSAQSSEDGLPGDQSGAAQDSGFGSWDNVDYIAVPSCGDVSESRRDDCCAAKNAGRDAELTCAGSWKYSDASGCYFACDVSELYGDSSLEIPSGETYVLRYNPVTKVFQYKVLVTKETPCHTLSSEFDDMTSQLSLRVVTKQSASAEMCAQAIAGEVVQGSKKLTQKPMSFSLYVNTERQFTTLEIPE